MTNNDALNFYATGMNNGLVFVNGTTLDVTTDATIETKTYITPNWKTDVCASDNDKLFQLNFNRPILDELKYNGVVYQEAKNKLNDVTKSVLAKFVDSDGLVYLDRNGKTHFNSKIIPRIIGIDVKNDTVVIIKFSDGTTEKAVLNKEDKFSLEEGISICITKKLLSSVTGGHGHTAYNKLINYAMKIYKQQVSDKENAKVAEEMHKKKRLKLAIKKAKKRDKQREARINEQAEAYRRALELVNTSAE